MAEKIPEPKLGTRIAWITRELKAIVATGNNQFDQSKKALSIQDVEEALRPLLGEHGVVINWSVKTAAQVDRLWRLDFHVTVFNAEDLDDKIEADWMDVGNSPSAAASFAVKGYYRRLFHLADEEDQQAIGAAPPRRAQRQGAESAALPQAAGDAGSETNGSSAPVSEPEDLAILAGLASTLKAPWDDRYLRQEIKAHGVSSVRQRLILLHARDCGKSPCDHVATLAGLK